MSEQLPDKPVNADGGTPPDNSDLQLNFLVPSSIELPWYKGIVLGIKELIHPPNLPPLEVTSKPMDFAKPSADTDVHLQHFLVPDAIELPWYKGIIQGVKELIHPPKLPPLEVTSKPVDDLPSLKGLYGGHETTAGLGSVVIHVAVVALLLLVGSLKPVQKAIKEFVPLTAPDLKDYKPKPKPEQSKGGGGSPQKTEVTKGELPKVAPKSFIPPIRTVEDPKLALTPTIVAPDLPNINSPNYGDPLGRLGIPSAGNGIGTGIGPGEDQALVRAAAVDSAAEPTRSAEASAPPSRFSGPSPSTPKKPAKPSGRAPCCCRLWWTKTATRRISRSFVRSDWAWIKRPSKRCRSGASSPG